MELRHLRLVETVAAEGNLTRAVNKLNVSASALSHQLREVENELGVRLFLRVNKRLVLTEAGKILLRSAQKVLRELEQAEYELMTFRDGQVGELRVTTCCYTCYHWLPGVMKSFSREFPGVEIKILTEYTCSSIAPLLEGKVDAIITSNLEPNPAVKFTELFRDEQMAVVVSGHPWEGKPYVEEKDFADQNVIIYSRPLESVTLFRQLLIPQNISPKKIIEVQLTEAQIEMVKAGYCVMVISNWAIEPYLKTQPIVAVPVTNKGLHRTWYFASLNNEKQPGYYEPFIKSLAIQMRDGGKEAVQKGVF
ncbi:MAG: LysR family transcriptional regulator [Cytophagales bacterium]|nr:LysR family transcriptional regulator [Cytophagales bacterium]